MAKHGAVIAELQRQADGYSQEMAKYERYVELRSKVDQLREAIQVLEKDDPEYLQSPKTALTHLNSPRGD